MPSVTKATGDDLIGCCASRIIDMATEIRRTHAMGVPHGEHDEPWTREFHQVVASIYLQTIPARYAKGVAESFKQCTTLMASTNYPADQAGDWLIVQAYAGSVTEAICGHLHLTIEELEAASGRRLEPTVPGIFPYAEIAPLVSPAGVARLLQASHVVQTACNGIQSVARPSEAEVELLRMLAAGKSVIEIAGRVGYSERSLHRRLKQLWKDLEVSGFKEALVLGGQEGWL
jgi:AraC-like DNA-binding protein